MSDTNVLKSEVTGLDVQAIAAAATSKVIEALQSAPAVAPSVGECARFDEDDDDADESAIDIETQIADFNEVDENDEPVAEPVTVAAPQNNGDILISGELANLLRASLRGGLTDVTNKVLKIILEG